MKHDEFQVEGHRFGNEVRALLRVDLRGALFHFMGFSLLNRFEFFWEEK